jgi:hypothetical protein
VEEVGIGNNHISGDVAIIRLDGDDPSTPGVNPPRLRPKKQLPPNVRK